MYTSICLPFYKIYINLILDPLPLFYSIQLYHFRLPSNLTVLPSPLHRLVRTTKPYTTKLYRESKTSPVQPYVDLFIQTLSLLSRPYLYFLTINSRVSTIMFVSLPRLVNSSLPLNLLFDFTKRTP